MEREGSVIRMAIVAGSLAIVMSSVSCASDLTGLTGHAIADDVINVVVVPASTSLKVGSSQEFRAAAFAGNGRPLAEQTVTWSSSNSAVVRVDREGMAVAIAAGCATVTATAAGWSGSAQVIVYAATTTDPHCLE